MSFIQCVATTLGFPGPKGECRSSKFRSATFQQTAPQFQESFYSDIFPYRHGAVLREGEMRLTFTFGRRFQRDQDTVGASTNPTLGDRFKNLVH